MKLKYLSSIFLIAALLPGSGCGGKKSKVVSHNNVIQLEKIMKLKLDAVSCDYKMWSQDLTNSFLIPSPYDVYITGTINLTPEGTWELKGNFFDWEKFDLPTVKKRLNLLNENFSVPEGNYYWSPGLMQKHLQVSPYACGVILLDSDAQKVFFYLHTI